MNNIFKSTVDFASALIDSVVNSSDPARGLCLSFLHSALQLTSPRWQLAVVGIAYQGQVQKSDHCGAFSLCF